MTLHLLKLCVGAESVEDLESWISDHLAQRRARGKPVEQIHRTRMRPKREVEILEGGSLYWVIKGFIQVRQKILEIRPVVDAEGIDRCDLVLEPVLHRTALQPRRPFQGWRYLDKQAAPPDARKISFDPDMPEALRRDLIELGLI